MSFGGVVLGLLTALGGVAFGGFAAGGVAFALVAAHGPLHFAPMALTETILARVTLAGWLMMTIGFTAGAAAAAYAWAMAAKARDIN